MELDSNTAGFGVGSKLGLESAGSQIKWTSDSKKQTIVEPETESMGSGFGTILGFAVCEISMQTASGTESGPGSEIEMHLFRLRSALLGMRLTWDDPWLAALLTLEAILASSLGGLALRLTRRRRLYTLGGSQGVNHYGAQACRSLVLRWHLRVDQDTRRGAQDTAL